MTFDEALRTLIRVHTRGAGRDWSVLMYPNLDDPGVSAEAYKEAWHIVCGTLYEHAKQATVHSILDRQATAATRWAPQPDITSYELAVALPILQEIANGEKPHIPGLLHRHFADVSTPATPLAGWKNSQDPSMREARIAAALRVQP